MFIRVYGEGCHLIGLKEFGVLVLPNTFTNQHFERGRSVFLVKSPLSLHLLSFAKEIVF